jgi:hypothetical protein
MANPFRDMGISDADLEREINESAEARRARKARAEEMVVYARSIAPKHHGDYAAGIRVVGDDPMKATVGAMNWKSHMIEDGTKADPADTHSRFGQDTPTPEFAVMARTADHFGHGSIESRIRER